MRRKVIAHVVMLTGNDWNGVEEESAERGTNEVGG